LVTDWVASDSVK